MNKIPESKQKRLQSLNQDILAVSPQRADTSGAPARNEAPRRSQENHYSNTAAASTDVSAMRLPVMLAAVALLLAVLVGIVGAMLTAQQSRGLAELQGQLPALQSRLAELESRLSAADQDVERSGSEVQSNVLQLSSRVRRLDTELSRLQGELRRTGSASEQTDQRISALESSLAEQRRQLTALGSQPAAQPAQVAPQVSEQEFAELSRQVDRLTADIRGLYRILEGR